jgi:hypothetical protein
LLNPPSPATPYAWNVTANARLGPIPNIMETTVSNILENKIKIVKDAIGSGQQVEIYSDYFAQDEKLVLRIEITKVNDEFTKLDSGLISKEQAEQLLRLRDSTNK